MKKRLYSSVAILLLLVACSFTAYAEDAGIDQYFQQGNKHYEEGDYDQAIKSYERILGDGNGSGAIYYNLGNAYFKVNNLGKAILNYERAKLFIPRDADLITNYKFAKSAIIGNIISPRGIWAWYPLRFYTAILTINEMTMLASGAFILILILFFLVIVRNNRNIYFLTALIAAILLLTSDIFVIWHKVQDAESAAVVTVSKTEVLFGPFESATKFFTLHEGAKINIVNQKDDWYKIKRSDGKVGWVEKTNIERVIDKT